MKMSEKEKEEMTDWLIAREECVEEDKKEETDLTVVYLKGYADAEEKCRDKIKKLEEELGVKLLERNKKYVKITPVGEVFLERVIDILKQVEDTSTEISDYKLNKKETIRIGIPPMIGSYLLPHLFDDFIVKYPHIHLDVKELGTVDIQKALTND